MTKVLKFLALVLAVPAAALLLAVPAYLAGYGHAEARGKAALEQLRLRQEQAHADGQRELNERLHEEARRAFLADFALQKERNNYAHEKQKLMERIGRAARGGRVFGADFISLWNEAIGAAPGTLPAAPDSGLPDDSARAAPAPGRNPG